MRDVSAGAIEAGIVADYFMHVAPLDFRKLEEPITLKSYDGRIYVQAPGNGVNWHCNRELVNDENRDYTVTYSDGVQENHEIKTQYAAASQILPNDGGMAKLPTGRIVIEIDGGCIENYTEFDSGWHGWYNRQDYWRGWFHPGDGTDANGNPYHADWYHHYMPLYKRDGAEIIDGSQTYRTVLNESELNEYFKVSQVLRPAAAIIVSCPPPVIISMTGDATKDIIEEYSKFRGKPIILNDKGERTGARDKAPGKRLDILVEANWLLDYTDKLIKEGKYNGQIVRTPMVEFQRLVDDGPGKGIFYIPDILYNTIAWTYKCDEAEAKQFIESMNESDKALIAQKFGEIDSLSVNVSVSQVEYDNFEAYNGYNRVSLHRLIGNFYDGLYRLRALPEEQS